MNPPIDVDTDDQGLASKPCGLIRRPNVRSRSILLSDYDMFLTENLVQGVDPATRGHGKAADDR
jgi:hypothetical protein